MIAKLRHVDKRLAVTALSNLNCAIYNQVGPRTHIHTKFNRKSQHCCKGNRREGPDYLKIRLFADFYYRSIYELEVSSGLIFFLFGWR